MKGWHLSSIFVLLVVGAIPSILDDAYGITYGVNIPEGAADIKQKVHYLPTEVTMTLEDKVQWWNNDNTAHTVTSGSYQGGPDGLFNSGILEPNDFYIFQPTFNDLGTLSYYCTLHPWMNGFITVLDPEGESVGRIAEKGSISAAENYVELANNFVSNAIEYVDLGYNNQAAVSFHQTALNFEKAAKEYSLLGDNQNAAKYYHEAGKHHHKAAVHLEKAQDFTQAVIHHLHAGIQHHFAGVQHEIMGDQKSAGKHFAESLMHKGMAKYGSDFVLAPKHQARWLADPADITCREGLELLQKSSTKEPVCVKSSSVERLIERGYGHVGQSMMKTSDMHGKSDGMHGDSKGMCGKDGMHGEDGKGCCEMHGEDGKGCCGMHGEDGKHGDSKGMCGKDGMHGEDGKHGKDGMHGEKTETSRSSNSQVSIALGSASPGCEETNECYLPYSVSIIEHSSVTWTNDDVAVHTATSGNPSDGPDGIFDSGLISPGASFTNQFDEEGTFDYYCIAHPWMTGKVNVLDN